MSISKLTENEIINIVLLDLFNNATEEGLQLNDEVLLPRAIVLSDEQLRKLKRLLNVTTFAQPTVVFDYAAGEDGAHVETGQYYLTTGGYAMLAEHQSYLKYLKFRKKEQRKPDLDRRVKNVNLIIAAAATIISLGVTVYTIRDSHQKERQSDEAIGLLNRRIDSLMAKRGKYELSTTPINMLRTRISKDSIPTHSENK